MHPGRLTVGLAATSLAVASGCPSKGSGRDGGPVPDPSAAVLTATVTVGRLTPVSVADLPDWALSGIDNCYTDRLLASPAQAGDITFTLRPPQQEGPVRVELRATGSLDAEVVACAKRTLGSIHHYTTSGGRAQREVAATIHLEPVTLPAPEPPTVAALRSALDDQYGRDGIVRVAGLTVLGIHQRKSSPDVLRDFHYTTDLVFLVDGYEARCHHGGHYKVFSRKPHEARGAGHVCESWARKAGDRAKDEQSMYFRLTHSGWQVGWEDVYYCGDQRCASAP